MLQQLKNIAFKIGLVMVIVFLLRTLASVIVSLIAVHFSGTPGYLMSICATVIFLDIFPIAFAMLIFGGFEIYMKNLPKLYRRPKKLVKVMGNLPALYGIGQSVNLATLLVIFLLSLVFPGVEATPSNSVESLQGATNGGAAQTVIFLLYLTLIGPFFEELLVRGVLTNALAPLGRGYAIVVSSVIFGLMHGSLQMLFYTTALGMALGYIAYATGSLFAPTIMHMAFNSIAGVMAVLSANSESSEVFSAFYVMFLLVIIILTIAGFGAFIKRIPTIRKYQFPAGDAAGLLTTGGKVKLVLTSWTVILSLILAADALSGQWLARLILLPFGYNTFK